jgi:hypothetical protein
VTTCTNALRITATDTVTCALRDGHAQYAHTDGSDNPEPGRHVGSDGSTMYVWSTRDAGIMNTLRNAGFHDQCDHTARKLIVADSLRPAILDLWQDSASSSDEPNNERLARWVERLIEHGDRDRRALKDAHRHIDELNPTGTAVGAAVGHLNMAVGVLTSARRRITGDYVNPKRKLDPLGPLDDGISRIKDAKKLLTGEPVAPCPECGIDLKDPGNPDGRCACMKPAEDVLTLVRQWGSDMYRLGVADRAGDAEHAKAVSQEADALITQVIDALQRLDGTTASAVGLLTGMTPEQLDDLGGFEKPEVKP